MKRKVIALMVAGVALGLVGKAIADGIPTVTPLTYTGVLQNSNGTAVTVQQSMQLTLWDDATANASVNQKCVTPTQNLTPDAQGRFQVQLDQACFDAVKANPNLWVQLQIGGTVLPRTKIAAVPYAVEAAKATRTVLSSGGRSTTAEGLYCGPTANTTGAILAAAGAVSGYRAAKLLCEQACTSPTAHMCSGLEVLRTHELGVSLPLSGWLKIGNYSVGGIPTTRFDCQGFLQGNAQDQGLDFVGSGWDEAAGGIGTAACNASMPVLCCD